MSEVFAIFNVPPFLSDGFTMLVVPALKPDDLVERVGPLFDEPPPPQADSTRASAAEPAATAPIFDLTRFSSSYNSGRDLGRTSAGNDRPIHTGVASRIDNHDQKG